MTNPSSSWFSLRDWQQSTYNKLPKRLQSAADTISSAWQSAPEAVKDTTKLVAATGTCYLATAVVTPVAAGCAAAYAISTYTPTPIKNFFSRTPSVSSGQVCQVNSDASTPSPIWTAESASKVAKESLSRQVKSASPLVIPNIPMPNIPNLPIPDVGSISELSTLPLPLAGKDMNPLTYHPPAAETANRIRTLIRQTRENENPDSLALLTSIPEDLAAEAEAEEEERLEQALLSAASSTSQASHESTPLSNDEDEKQFEVSSTHHRRNSEPMISSFGDPGPLSAPLGPLNQAPAPIPSVAFQPPSPATQSPAADSAVDKSAELRQNTDRELDRFITNIQSYATLHIIHEFVAGQKTPVEGDVYRKIMKEQDAPLKSGETRPSLWKVYWKHLGKDLKFFPKVKAALFYFFFYHISGIILTAMDEFIRSLVNSFRRDLTRGPALKNLTGIILQYAETFLNVYSGAIKKYHDEHGAKGSLDDYKKAAINQMIETLFQRPVDKQTAKASEIAVHAFFSPIELTFKSLKRSGVAPLRWIGNVLSFIIDTPINFAIKTILKKKAIPTVIASILQETENTTHERDLLISRSIYETAIEQLAKILPLINGSGPRKPLPELNGAERLPAVSALLAEVLNLTPHETPAALAKALDKQHLPANHFERIMRWVEEGGAGLIQEGIQKGIEDAARLGLGILHDTDNMEEIFGKVLNLSNTAFSSSVDFEKLKTTCETAKTTLNIDAKNVFQEIIKHSISEKLEPSFEPAAVQTRHIYSNEQKKIEAIFESFWNLTVAIEDKIELAAQGDKASVIEEIDEFCDQMQNFVNATSVQHIPDNIPGLTPVIREGLDRVFQPLRERALHLIERIGQLKVAQQKHDAYSQISEGFEKVQQLIGSLERDIGPHSTLDDIQSGCNQIEIMTPIVRDGIAPRLARTLPALAESLIDQTIAIGQASAQLLEARERTLSAESLCSPDGQLAKLIKYNQHDRKNMSGFQAAQAMQEIRKQLSLMGDKQGQLTSSIEEMETFIPYSNRGDWNLLLPFLLKQIPPLLHEKARNLINSHFREMKRGHEFSEREFNVRENQFLGNFTQEEQSLLYSPLNQIRSFLSKNSIINAHWRRFRDQVEQIREIHKTRQNAAYGDLNKAIRTLRDLAIQYHPGYAQGVRKSHRQMTKIMRQIKDDVTDLIETAAKIEPEKQLDLQPFLATAGGVSGLVSGIGMNYFLPWPIAATLSGAAGMFMAKFYKNDRTISAVKGGAAGLAVGVLPYGSVIAPALAGAYVGQQVPNIIQDYGTAVIYPAVKELLDNALKESMKRYTYRGLFLMGLNGFVNYYGKNVR